MFIPGSTASYVQFHARQRPESIALINNGRQITYREFYVLMVRFMRVAARFGLSPGDAVAIELRDAYTHWLLTLGFENLGVTTASFRAIEGEVLLPLLDNVDLVLWGAPVAGARVKRAFAVTPDWLEEIASGRMAERHQGEFLPPGFLPTPEDRLRIIRSSGTTGGQKRMIKTRRHVEGKLDAEQRLKGFPRGSRHLITTGFTVHTGYVFATACLRSAAVAVFDDTRPIGGAIGLYRPSAVYLIPIGAARLLEGLPPDFSKPECLVIHSTGAPLEAALRRELLDRVATEIVDAYGSNEAGMICLVDADGIGTVVPEAIVEIVDENDAVVPLKAAGRLRARTLGMSSAYLDAPAATREAFRDGWFYTGDLAAFVAPGRVKILGRVDDVINLRGIKLMPGSIEADLMRLPAAAGRDLAVTSVRGKDGSDWLCVALAGPDGGPDDDSLRDEIGRLAPLYLRSNPVLVRRLEALPRNANGKLRRHELKAIFEAVVQRFP